MPRLNWSVRVGSDSAAALSQILILSDLWLLLHLMILLRSIRSRASLLLDLLQHHLLLSDWVDWRLRKHLPLIDLNVERILTLLNSSHRGRTLILFRGIFLLSTSSDHPFHIVLQVLVLEFSNAFSFLA